MLGSTQRCVDQQATRRAQTGPGVTIDSGRLSGSQIVTNFLKVTAVPRDMLTGKDIYEQTGGFLHGFNLYEDWLLKQKLSEFDGINGLVHSGAVGTYYSGKPRII